MTVPTETPESLQKAGSNYEIGLTRDLFAEIGLQKKRKSITSASINNLIIDDILESPALSGT